jgi:hypothetical protein
MTRDEAIQKAAKLLRLAQSDNPNEAGIAAAKAQEILDRYEISRNLLELDGVVRAEPEEAIEDFKSKGASLDADMGAKLSTWRVRLASQVAHANGCAVYTSQTYSYGAGWKRERSRTIEIVGQPSDVEKTRYLYAYLVRECERFTERDGKGCGATWRNNFRLGFVDEVSSRLLKARKETIEKMKAEAVGLSTGDTAYALARIDKAALAVVQKGERVDAWMGAHLKLKSGRSSQANYDRDARDHGRNAGREVTIGGARAALGAEPRKLGGGS